MKGKSTMATQSARAIGLKTWLGKVRTLAPEARIPYITIILAEAYEAGISPQQFVEALPPPHSDTNWMALISISRRERNCSWQAPGEFASGGFRVC
jgi:hypothetical protein